MTLLVRGSDTESLAKPARGFGAHVEGVNASATGASSHAEGDSTTASNSNAHAEGSFNTASGAASHAEGSGNTASGAQAHAEGGSSNTASGASAHAEGATNTASGNNSHAGGYGASASRYTQFARGSYHVHATVAQILSFTMGAQTTSATPVVMFSESFSGAAVLTGAGTNVLTVPAKNAYTFRIEVVARRTDSQGEMAGFKINGLIGRDATGSARIIGTPTSVSWADSGASTWTCAVSVNTTNATNNYLAITVTGEASKTISWIAGLYATEVLTGT